MPQASQETVDAWPHGQGAAIDLLDTNFKEKGGWYTERNPAYQPTEQEYAALQYLCEEWDYGYVKAACNAPPSP